MSPNQRNAAPANNAKLFSRLADYGEWGMRQVYWRVPRLVDAIRSRRTRPVGPSVRATEFEDHLSKVIPAGAKPYLIHSSIEDFALVDEDNNNIRGMAVALWLLRTLRICVGPQATICMPTHPRYDDDPGFMFDKSLLTLRYDVRRSPSRVGLMTEFFRRRSSSQRSLHPLSSISAEGPLATSLLDENLSGLEPLPHGKNSAYHKVCLADGLVVGIGLSLIKSMTILHVAEELADQNWPIPNFFYQRQFEIVDQQGRQRDQTVRERRPEFVRSLILAQIQRDLLSAGILREHHFQGIRVETADAPGVLQFIQDRQRHSTYPYLWPRVALIGKARRVADNRSK